MNVITERNAPPPHEPTLIAPATYTRLAAVAAAANRPTTTLIASNNTGHRGLVGSFGIAASTLN
jgi:hypothetical protein